jgi:hypothetical protein
VRGTLSSLAKAAVATIALLLGGLTIVPSPAGAVGYCYFYSIDCTDPNVYPSPSGCGAGATGINELAYTIDGVWEFNWQFRYNYSSSCNSAWSRVPSQGGFAHVVPYLWAERSQPNATNTQQTSVPYTNNSQNGSVQWSRQLKDCCGGFLVRACALAYSTLNYYHWGTYCGSYH